MTYKHPTISNERPVGREVLVKILMKMRPQNYEEFVKQLGRWSGLNDALQIIEDLRKKDADD